VTYLFEYNGPTLRPRWVRVIVDSNNTEQKIFLNFNNVEERKSLSADDVYIHLENLVQYMKDVSQGVSPIGLDDPLSTDGWHFNGGWGEVEWAKNECLKWWEFVYYKDEIEDSEAPE
jgi:hypothetical protein